METPLIIKELVKHETKFNGKVWKLVFRILMFHERQKVFHGHFAALYTMTLTWNKYLMKQSERTCFMKRSERNASQCILTLTMNRLHVWKLYSRLKSIVITERFFQLHLFTFITSYPVKISKSTTLMYLPIGRSEWTRKEKFFRKMQYAET